MTVGKSEDRRGKSGDVFPLLFLCLAPIIWGWSGVLVRWAGLPGSEHVIVFWRSVFAFAFYVAAVLLSRDLCLSRPGAGLLLMLSSGLATAAYTICAFKAYNLMAIGPVTFIIYLAPVLVAVLAPLVLKERLERPTFLCLGLALTGTALLSLGRQNGPARSHLTGALLALAAAVCWAVLMLIWKKLREKHSPLTIGLWTNGVCTLVYAPFAVRGTGALSAKGWASVVVFGLVVIGVASLIYLYALKRVKAQEAALLSYIEPVSATVLGITLLGDSPHWQEFAGAFLILLAGVLLLRLRRVGEEVAGVFDAAER